MASMIVPIQGTESSDATHANVVAFYKVDDEHYIKSVQAWDYNGYVIATRDLPKLDAGCDYYRCSMPAPGGWCEPDRPDDVAELDIHLERRRDGEAPRPAADTDTPEGTHDGSRQGFGHDGDHPPHGARSGHPRSFWIGRD